MSKANCINEVKMLMPEVRKIFQKYARHLKEGQVPLEELLFTKILSKDFDEYQNGRNTVENSAINLLNNKGKTMRAGEVLRYVITDYYQRYSIIRAVPVELIDLGTEVEKISYDQRRYIELLAETCNSVIEHFGCSVPSQPCHNMKLSEPNSI